jgi:hypothetical protein
LSISHFTAIFLIISLSQRASSLRVYGINETVLGSQSRRETIIS